VHRIETLGLATRQLGEPGGDDLETGLLETAVDLADHVLGDGIGLDDGKGALQRHGSAPGFMKDKENGRSEGPQRVFVAQGRRGYL
jgi:hypothetical protein